MLIDEEKKQICGLGCKIFLPFFFTIIFLTSVTISFFVFLFPAPVDFQTGKIFDIPKGSSTFQIANILENEKFIRSAESFVIFDEVLSFMKKEKSLKAGKYIFKKQKNLLEVYKQIASGESGIEMLEIRTIEGEPNYLVVKIFLENEELKNFSEEKFLELAKEEEGFLYPDTYKFSPFADEKLIIQEMKRIFDKKTAGLFDNLNEDEIREIIIIASLIENEAGSASYETKQHVAGIIYNRLEKEMLLQVDAVFSYIYGYHIKRVLNKHLEVDSPYNTYKYIGLPPGPIGNPSIASIKAALDPLETRDLYYLTAADGIFYYAQTGTQHNQNRIHLK